MEQQLITNGGLQNVPQIAVQYVYLDFDGELTSYNGEILTIDNVEVKDPALTEERIANIVAELNAKYASQNVIFVTERPESAEYSTIFVGKTSAFDAYGDFAGLAETIDEGNLNKSDNAFVMLDHTSSDEEIISTIAHETDHLLGTLDHGGEGLAAYADEYHVSSGMTSSGVLLSDDSMYIFSGGTANNIRVNYEGRMHIYAGGAANSTTVNVEGYVYVSGGTANSTTVNSSGYLAIYSGGTANFTTVNDGDIYIQSSGTANSTTVNSGGRLYVSSGGTANSTTVNSGGRLYVSSGGTANSTTVNSSGYLHVLSGGTASNDTVSSRGELYVSSGGTVRNATVKSQGCLYLSGGVANSTITEYMGIVDIFSGGVANSTVNIGKMYISNGGAANNTIVKNGGSMVISSGGVANDVIFSGGSMVIFSGGVANDAIFSGGNMFIFLDGTANRTIVSSGASMRVNAGVANNTIVNSMGGMYVRQGGIANSTTVNNSGFLYLHGSGTATNTVIQSGCMYVYSYAVASSTLVSDGRLIISGGIANRTTISSRGSMCIHVGGTANSVSVSSGGYLYIHSGGVAKNTVNNDVLYISSGGTTNSTTVLSVGMMYVYGTANSTVLQDSADMLVKSGGIANRTTMSSASLYISGGGTANSTTVNYKGHMQISGGVANYTTVNDMGQLEIFSGAANSTTVNSNGRVYISSGGVLRGRLNIASGAIISAYTGSVVDFTVSERTTSSTYLINDLSLISGTPSYNITVSDGQAAGTYKLARGASAFAGSVTVGNETVDYGTVTVNGDDLAYGDKTFSLDQSGGDLTLTITRKETELSGDVNGVTWNGLAADRFVVEYSKNDYSNILQIETESNAADTFGLPADTYQWRVKMAGGEFVNGDNIVSDNTAAPQNLVSDADEDMDLFFADTKETWGSGYVAEHRGVKSGWTGTKEQVSLTGKNRISDVFSGSDDANVLVLTDYSNGDALFVEDIYTTFGKDAARFSQIDEIRAGAGNDIIDMTSQRFAYAGDEMTIRGGLGDDTIWATGGDNDLFGDAGNDRIIGSEGFDLIVGGAGDDSMHTGGGGNDIFAFCEDWGNDTVQLTASDNGITLWFASGSKSNWDAEDRIYSDGSNSVTVTGGADCTISLKFGDEGGQYDDLVSVGAFASAASEKIFEDKDSGMLA